MSTFIKRKSELRKSSLERSTAQLYEEKLPIDWFHYLVYKNTFVVYIK